MTQQWDRIKSRDAAEYLGIPYVTLNRWIKDPDMPIQGELFTASLRLFTREELDTFKKYMEEHGLPKRGRPHDPTATYHGRHEKYYGQGKRGQVVNIQRVADGLKALVSAKKQGNPAKIKTALNAINHFETLAWHPTAFAEHCPMFEVQDDGCVIYKGEASIFGAVIDGLKAYEEAIPQA